VVSQLTAQCEAVVNHLRDTTSGKVSVARMELYFKLDGRNKCVRVVLCVGGVVVWG